jgi:hypothetical protein
VDGAGTFFIWCSVSYGGRAVCLCGGGGHLARSRHMCFDCSVWPLGRCIYYRNFQIEGQGGCSLRGGGEYYV